MPSSTCHQVEVVVQPTILVLETWSILRHLSLLRWGRCQWSSGSWWRLGTSSSDQWSSVCASLLPGVTWRPINTAAVNFYLDSLGLLFSGSSAVHDSNLGQMICENDSFSFPKTSGCFFAVCFTLFSAPVKNLDSRCGVWCNQGLNLFFSTSSEHHLDPSITVSVSHLWRLPERNHLSSCPCPFEIWASADARSPRCSPHWRKCSG